jgi:coenzyme F420 hydrogenase subunit beta
MRRRAFTTVKSITDWRLCLGCGACAYVCPIAKIDLVDIASEGIRPTVADENCAECRDCLSVCPAYENDHRHLSRTQGILNEFSTAFGPVLEVCDAYARDPEIRWKGSSGGLLTALSLY